MDGTQIFERLCGKDGWMDPKCYFYASNNRGHEFALALGQ